MSYERSTLYPLFLMSEVPLFPLFLMSEVPLYLVCGVLVGARLEQHLDHGLQALTGGSLYSRL